MSQWAIDPSTGDYVMENGKPVLTDSLQVPAYYRVKTPRGKWMYAPNTNYGNDAALLQKKTGNSIIKMTEQALKPIIDDGRAKSVTVEINPDVQVNRNNAAVKITIIDAEGQPQLLDLPAIGV